MADRPVANARDLPAFAGVLLSASALAMPWYRRRDCPIFEECGPWQDVSGWEAFGLVALIGLGLALLLAVVVRGPVLRRLLPAACCVLLGGALAVFQAGASIVIFADQQGPLPGFWLFCAGLVVAVAAWVAALAWTSIPRPPEARS